VGEFKVGDRVRYDGTSGEYFSEEYLGKVGTVVSISERNVRIHWDDGSCPPGVLPGNLKLLLVKDPIPAAITEYHDACAAFEEAQLAVEKAKARIEDARLALKEALG
jgi:hypothetical protein